MASLAWRIFEVVVALAFCVTLWRALLGCGEPPREPSCAFRYRLAVGHCMHATNVRTLDECERFYLRSYPKCTLPKHGSLLDGTCEMSGRTVKQAQAVVRNRERDKRATGVHE